MAEKTALERLRLKRIMSGECGMPDDMGGWYTQGELAALAVVAGEVRQHGECALPVDEIADHAGVSRTTVQNALRYAGSEGHVVIEARYADDGKQRPNVIRIASRHWMKHMRRMEAHGLLAVQYRSLAALANREADGRSALPSV